MGDRTVHNPIFGDTATFLETASSTGGRRTRLDIDVSPNGGVPAHFHEFDEVLEAKTGPLEVVLGNERRVLQPGERVVVPRGVRHSWRNASPGRVRFEVLFEPAQAGFEDAVRVGYGLARDGRTTRGGVPKSLGALALLVAWSGDRLPGIGSLFMPVLTWLARRAEASGLSDRLREQYGCDPRPTGAVPVRISSD